MISRDSSPLAAGSSAGRGSTRKAGRHTVCKYQDSRLKHAIDDPGFAASWYTASRSCSKKEETHRCHVGVRSAPIEPDTLPSPETPPPRAGSHATAYARGNRTCVGPIPAPRTKTPPAGNIPLPPMISRRLSPNLGGESTHKGPARRRCSRSGLYDRASRQQHPSPAGSGGCEGRQLDQLCGAVSSLVMTPHAMRGPAAPEGWLL